MLLMLLLSGDQRPMMNYCTVCTDTMNHSAKRSNGVGLAVELGQSVKLALELHLADDAFAHFLCQEDTSLRLYKGDTLVPEQEDLFDVGLYHEEGKIKGQPAVFHVNGVGLQS